MNGKALDLTTVVSPRLKGTTTKQNTYMQFHLDNMTCGGCARTVTKVIQNLDPEASIVTDPPTRKVEIQTLLSVDLISDALREAGFPPRE